MKQDVVAMARAAGVVGAGGAGFPTHVKLNARVDTVIVNGAECEPLLAVDKFLLVTNASRLMAMLEQVRMELGADRAIVAIKAKNTAALEAVQKVIDTYSNLHLLALGDFYPAGDEFILAYEVTGRMVPIGGIPLDIGLVVLNVETLWNLAQAMDGAPVTHKWVTVTGAVSEPGTFLVPLGISVADMIALAGGAICSDFSVLNGGPLMGKVVTTLKEPVTKTTKGLVVLPSSSPVMRGRQQPLEVILRHARSVCCQCQMCTDLCPRYLLGHPLLPHKIMLAASYPGSDVSRPLAQAYLCSECGVCELYACPQGLSPRRVLAVVKEQLQQLGHPNSFKGGRSQEHPWRPFRRIPTTRLIQRLGLGTCSPSAPFREYKGQPVHVVLPLKQHVGAPAVPLVEPGAQVKVGDLLAELPEGKLGACIHASVTGMVTDVSAAAITIEMLG